MRTLRFYVRVYLWEPKYLGNYPIIIKIWIDYYFNESCILRRDFMCVCVFISRSGVTHHSNGSLDVGVILFKAPVCDFLVSRNKQVVRFFKYSS
jgi:hypothetical protein